MEIVTIVASAALMGGALYLILLPLQNRKAAMLRTSASGQTATELEVRYQAALTAIKDLMFDFEMGKMSQDDYNILLAKIKQEAAQIRKEIDRLTAHGVSPALDAEIETLVTQTRGQLQHDNGSAALLAEIDARIERLKVAQGNGHITTCPKCHARVMLGDAYCASCGHTLDEISLKSASVRQCAACHGPVQPGDAFCASCGAPLDPMTMPYGELSAI